MQLLSGTLILSASDLTGYLDCEHLTQMDVSVALGERAAPVLEDPELDIVRRRGSEHEASVLAGMRASGLSVVEIARPAPSVEAYRAACDATLAALGSGVDVIYQAVLFDGHWLGFADFLERVPGTSRYEVVDTKLARRAKTSALVQTALYSWLLEKLTGSAPEQMHLVLGDGSRQSFRVADYAAYVTLARGRLEAAVSARPATYPEPVEHCGVCRWREECRRD